MARKNLSTTAEKAQIVKLLSQGSTSLEISKKIGRDHRTVKAYIENPSLQDQGEGVTENGGAAANSNEDNYPEVDDEELACHGVAGAEAVREAVQWLMDAVGEDAATYPETAVELTKEAIKRYSACLELSPQELEQCAMPTAEDHWLSLDGPDGWARGWILDGAARPSQNCRQQGGGGLIIWAGVIAGEVVGPARVEPGVKLDSKAYTQLLEASLFRWYRSKPLSFKRKLTVMLDNAPSHGSKFTKAFLEKKGFVEGRKLMVWPPRSPDLNPCEHYWSLLKKRVYAAAKQFNSVEELWQGVTEAAADITSEEIRTLTESMDRKLEQVLMRRGNHVGA
ncbi:hypothetical protein FOZ60_002139 [Perkinsus olseni]|uniref:Tc1-like transposase DDE domain-containing protein n=1 Tax=Perkinsus olseni TaxID=32597 RepID=A0A7J6NZ01_PEROL|nr:hypothetical protein FOZ60_002139 [Perkinsus olseni]